MRVAARKALASLAVLFLVGAFGSAHGGRLRPGHTPDLGDVVSGLCNAGTAESSWPEDVPRYPGSTGVSLDLGGEGRILVSRAPAGPHVLRPFLVSAFSRAGWTEQRPSGGGDAGFLWFRRDGQECLVDLTLEYSGETDVLIIVR